MDWTKEQPAVIFLRRWVSKWFPEVGLHYDSMKTVEPRARKVVRDHPSHGVGGYVSRQTESGGFSLHSEGRAADIYLKVQNPLLKAIGTELFNRFVTYSGQLGLEEVIWNGQIWSAKAPRVHAIRAGRDQHTDHVHVGFTRAGSQQEPTLLLILLGEVRDAVDAQFPSR